MATIKCLPDEVIEIILGYNDVSIEDINNFRCVWKQLHSTAKYVESWERIFFHRWPSAKKVYEEQYKENERKDSEENEQKDEKNLLLDFVEIGINCAMKLWDYVSQIIWPFAKKVYEEQYKEHDKDSEENEQNNEKILDFIETGINYARELRNYVSQIIHKHYYNNESIDNLILFEDVFHLDQQQHLRNNIDKIINEPENFIKYCFFIDEINYLLTQSPQRIGCDLTERYCNQKLFHYMKQHSMKKKLNRYPDELLERIATLMAQAVQPEKNVFYSCVKASLDNIALEVLNCLREKHPDHSIFSTSAEIFSYWKNNNIDDNHWNEVEGTQIMDTLEKYIFDELNFQPCRLENRNVINMCIDIVLKYRCGQEIILLIIYESVARRLGLRCDLIIQMQTRLEIQTRPLVNIFWKPKHATKSSENVRYLNIISEKFSHVNQLSLIEDWRFLKCNKPYKIEAAKLWEVIKYLYIFPQIPDAPYQVISNNYRNTSNFYVKRIEQFNTRPEGVKFAVGMIVRCQLTNCAGVIVGWHRNGDKENMWFIDSFWKYNINTQMYFRHCNFYNTRQQTHYIILTERDELCYIGEDRISDRITLTTPKWIDNSEIGRYFCKFKGTHYVPNQMLARHYPHDAAICETKTTISE